MSRIKEFLLPHKQSRKEASVAKPWTVSTLRASRIQRDVRLGDGRRHYQVCSLLKEITRPVHSELPHFVNSFCRFVRLMSYIVLRVTRSLPLRPGFIRGWTKWHWVTRLSMYFQSLTTTQSKMSIKECIRNVGKYSPNWHGVTYHSTSL